FAPPGRGTAPSPHEPSRRKPRMSGREHGHDPALPHSAQALAPQPHATDELEVVPGFERENLQGWIPQLATEADVRAVIEKAFDYRGDITITRRDGSQVA